MSEIGILAFGAYIPVTRLQRSAIHAANGWFAGGLKGLAKGEKAVANWDEDAITMGVEAARDLFDTRERTPDSILFASTTHVFADRQNAGVIKEALNLGDVVGALDVGGSQRAGTSALITALDSAAAGKQVLHIAAERPVPTPASEREMQAGDAAAALLVGPSPAAGGSGGVGQGDLAAKLLATHSLTLDFVDHFRETGEDADYDWEARWVRDEGFGRIAVPAIAQALAKAGLEGSAVTHFIAPIAVRGVPEFLAKKAGIPDSAIVAPPIATIGHAGAAQATLMLAAVLETAKAGEIICLLGFGQGADVLLFEATGKGARPRLGVSGWLARRFESQLYMKYLFHRDLIQLERGARAEHDAKTALTAMWRNRKAVMALVGGRCTKTGTVQFPMSEVSVNPNDHAIRTQEEYPLAEVPARVMTWTADALTYSPEPPNCYGNIEFEGGGRMMAEFTDIAPQDLDVGIPLRMMFRIKAVDEKRHFRRYFWKAAPAF